MAAQSSRRPSPLVLSLAAVALVMGWECYAAIAHRAQIDVEWRARLSKIASDEQRLIEDWLAQRTELGRLAASKAWVQAVVEQHGSPEATHAASSLARQQLPLWEVAIFDRAHGLLFDEPAGSATGLQLHHLAPSSSSGDARPGATIAPAGGRGDRISLLMPIEGPDSSGAYLVLSQSPSLSFDSVLSQSETNPATGESLLVERDGREVRTLTRSRFPAAPAAEADDPERLPSAAVAAAERAETVGRFVDHRNQIVLAATRPIAGTSWGLLVKVDESEAFAPWRREVAGRILRSLLFVFAVTAVAWNARQAERLRTVLELSRRDARYRLLVGRAHDAVLVARAQDGRILEANHAAERLYGCSADELRGLRLMDLRGVESRTDIQQRLLEPTAGEPYESRHRRRDGTQVHVEVAGGRLEGDEEPLVLAIVRDVSRRKAAEERFARIHRLIRATAEISQSVSRLRDPSRLLQLACEQLVAVAGFSAAQIRRAADGDGEVVARAGDASPSPPATGERVIGDLRTRITNATSPPDSEADLDLSADSPRRPSPAITVGFATALGERYALTVHDGESLDGDREQLLARLVEHLAVTLDARDADRARNDAEAEVRRINAELEERVLERTERLANANRELEAFAYSVSHDLRAPLRAISGFASILDEQHSGALDEDGKRLLEVVRRNAARMSALIDDLLALSRASRQELRSAQVDMNGLVQSVWAELAHGDTVELVVGALPPAHGDSELLRLIWFHLLENALKFTAPCERRRVEVEARIERGGVCYSVRDNGVGFDMAYADKLFTLFQRLHGRDEFEGTGVGLALVHRIVQRHGGRAWCAGVPGEGATFSFWIPGIAGAAAERTAQDDPSAPSR